MRGLFAGICFSAVACACQIPDLPLTYPPLVRQARIQGSGSLTVTFDPDAQPFIKDQVGFPLLRDHVAAIIKNADYPPDCAGASVEIQFAFVLYDCAQPPRVSVERISSNGWRINGILSENQMVSIACGVRIVRRRFPLSFLTRREHFCNRTVTKVNA